MRHRLGTLEGRHLGRLPRIEAAAGEGPLSAMPPQPGRPPGEDDGCLSGDVRHHDQRHGGGPAVSGGHAAPVETGEMVPHRGAQVFIEGR